MDIHHSISALLIAAFALGLAACGASNGAAEKTTGAAEPQSASGRIRPCALLTDAEVKTVVPDLTGSMVTANGESLMKSVESYQCSYVNSEARGLLVIIHIAVDAATFDQIKGSATQHEKLQRLNLGDASWLYPQDGGLSITVHKGRAVIDLNLTTPDAAKQGPALTALARTVVTKVN